RLRLQISGMTCASCATRIERKLGRLAGVTAASVNPATGTASVEALPGAVTSDALVRVVRELGYDARPADEGGGDVEREAREREIRRQRNLFILSGALSLPLLLAMVGRFFGGHGAFWDLLHIGWFQWALAKPVQFHAGWQF